MSSYVKHRQLVELIANLETSEEFDARTNDEGMCGDDAVETLSSLVRQARVVIREEVP